MPTIVYCCSEPVMCEISMEEFMRRESMPQIIAEETGRMARRYIREYDEIHAEILCAHNAEKAKVRNRRKADRKHKLTPKMRKEQEYLRNWNVCMKMVNFGTWDDIPIVEGRVRSAEKIARADFDIEQINIADAMQEYADYCLMAEQHEERLEYLRSLTGSVEFWEMMIDYVSREKIYEENRIREMRSIADSIMKGECY